MRGWQRWRGIKGRGREREAVTVEGEITNRQHVPSPHRLSHSVSTLLSDTPFYYSLIPEFKLFPLRAGRVHRLSDWLFISVPA